MFLENIVGGAAAAQPCMILEFFWTFGYFRYKIFVSIQIYSSGMGGVRHLFSVCTSIGGRHFS